MWGRLLKSFILLQLAFLLKSPLYISHAKGTPSPTTSYSSYTSERSPSSYTSESALSPYKARILLYEGTRASKNPCYAKVETYNKANIKDWYFSAGDDQIKLGFEPEHRDIKDKTVKISGTFQSFRMGSIHQIPNMLASSQIRPTYVVNSELDLEDDGSPRAFSFLVKNKNFMREFPDKDFICHDLRLMKYWPCYQAIDGFELRNGWCTRTELEDDILF